MFPPPYLSEVGSFGVGRIFMIVDGSNIILGPCGKIRVVECHVHPCIFGSRFYLAVIDSLYHLYLGSPK